VSAAGRPRDVVATGGMSKRSRRRARDNRLPTGPARPVPRGGLHMTVAALNLRDIDIRHETRLVKSALLYADSVTLLSLGAWSVALLAQFAGADRADRARIAAGFTGRLNAESARQYEEMRGTIQSAQEQRLFRLMEQHERLSEAEIIAEVELMMRDAGADELPKAMAAGLLNLQRVGGKTEDLSPAVAGILLDEVAELLKGYVATGADTFPLFDDGAGNMLRAMLKSGKLVDPKRSHANEAGIAGRLIDGLEAFPDADMDVILDVRDRLQVPLVRFRSALSRASVEFGSATWDEEFSVEFDDYYRREVAPALLNVRESLEDLGVRPTLLRLAASKNVVPAVAIATAATLGLAAIGGLHADLPHLLYGTPGLAGVATEAATEAGHRDQVHGTAKQNPFYFLYQANETMGT
jgi:hypothetical protein